jgi:acetyl esterase/lipase
VTTRHLVSPEARELLAYIPSLVPTVETLADFRATILSLSPVEDVGQEERFVPGLDGAAQVRVLIYRPASMEGPAPAILYVHGGGFIAGSPDIMNGASQKLADTLGAVVVAVQYRLAPEAPFPGAVEDCCAALDWLFADAEALGVDPARIAIYGQSAGGGLAAAAALLMRDRGRHRLAAQFLLYPMLDPRTGAPDAPIDNLTTGEFMWTRPANQFGWAAMRGPGQVEPARLGYFAPSLAADLADLPATFVAVGSLDLFLEEDTDYALRLSRAGVPIELHIYPGGVHGFDVIPGDLSDQYWTAFHAAAHRWLQAG